jgi:hypothetical protein
VKKLARGLHLITAIAVVATGIVVLLAAEVLWVLPWGWAYLSGAVQHLWSTPFGALTLRDFGQTIIGAVVAVGSVPVCIGASANLISSVTENFSARWSPQRASAK